MIGLRRRGIGWVIGRVVARERAGRPALELRKATYALTLDVALQTIRAAPARWDKRNGARGAAGGFADAEPVVSVPQGLLDEPGQALDDARQRAGLSKRALSERSGVSYRQVRRILAGQATPSVATLAKLVGALQ